MVVSEVNVRVCRIVCSALLMHAPMAMYARFGALTGSGSSSSSNSSRSSGGL